MQVIVQLDTRGGVPIYRQVMDQITRAIVSGQLSVGQQLDSVAELSKRLKVNPMTISKAYGYLVEEHLVERRPGIGLFVKAVAQKTKRKGQEALLFEAMEKAAVLAIQLNMDSDDASELFMDHFKTTSWQRVGDKT